MKKIVYLFVSVLFSSLAIAQQFTLNPKQKSAEGPSGDTGEKSAISVITNSSTNAGDSMIKWKVVEFDVPSGWQFDFCDPYDCIANLALGSANKFKLKIGASGGLKGNFYSKGIAGSATVKVVLEYENGSGTPDTLTLMAKGWATGLKQVRNSAEVSLFPNPCHNEVTLKYPAAKPIEVNIYNVLGSKVKTFVHSGSETTLNISDLQKGLYFIRFTQGDVMISKSFTKMD